MEKQVKNIKRRNFLKILALGGGALVLGKIFGVFDFLSGDGATNVQDFKNFKVSENNKNFTISSKNGEDLFIMDDGK